MRLICGVLPLVAQLFLAPRFLSILGKENTEVMIACIKQRLTAREILRSCTADGARCCDFVRIRCDSIDP